MAADVLHRSPLAHRRSIVDTALVTLKSFARGGDYRSEGLKPYLRYRRVGTSEKEITSTVR